MTVNLSKDLRGIFGVARDQGCRPTCLAFAISDTHAALSQPFRPFSVEYLYYHGTRRMPNCIPSGGISLAAASEALAIDGQPLEQDWPYLSYLPKDLSSWLPPAQCTVFRRVPTQEQMNFPQICSTLDTGRAVVIILRLSESFYTPSANSLIDHVSHDPDTGLHAIIAVGYGKLGNDSCILIRNSWGPTWGMCGYAFLTERYLGPRLISTSIIN